jgi:hypothetical protein
MLCRAHILSVAPFCDEVVRREMTFGLVSVAVTPGGRLPGEPTQAHLI